MEIYLNTHESDYEMWGEVLPTADVESLVDGCECVNVEKAETVNIGPGADVIAILLRIKDIVFDFGAFIATVDSCIKLARWVRSLRKKKKIAAIDEAVANILAVDYVIQCEGHLESIERLDSHTFELSNGFIYKVFVMAYRVNNDKIFVVNCDTDANVSLVGVYDDINNYGLIHKSPKYLPKE